MAEDFINVFAENDLTRLLQLWLTPGTPRTLDRRITRSFLWINDYQLGFASPRITPTHTEVSMKRCNACDEEFADKFSFCPVDGTPLNTLAAALIGQGPADGEYFALEGPGSADEYAAARRREFNVTMISGASLAQRLATEISFVIEQIQRAWPEFKRDPIGSGSSALIALASRFKKTVLAPNALAGGVAAMLAVLFAVLALMLVGRAAPTPPDGSDIEQPVVQIISIRPPDQNVTPEGSGIGAGSEGRVGLAKGKGEGSEPKQRPSRGGGGGGNHDLLATNQGTVPQVSEIPAPINPPPPNPALPLAGIDIDPALWKSSPSANYGDPRSKSNVASKGSGDGEGIGTGNGQGIGEGNGDGFGPGNDGNIGGGDKERGGNRPGGGDGNHTRDAERVWPTRDLTQRARVISKPEAGYTEEARRTQITGTVVLRAVFSLTGEVTGIHTIKPLPGGLTEKAIAAARQIRFVPAMRDGHPVSCYMQLEYNFNLY